MLWFITWKDRIRVMASLIAMAFFWAYILLFGLPVEAAFVRDESINERIDVYYQYTKRGKTFANLITYLNNNLDKKYDLLFVSPVTLSASASIPTNAITVRCERGGYVTGNYTVTLNGQVIMANPDQLVFSTTVTVTGSINNQLVYTNWFGTVMDGTTISTVGLQTALDISVGGGSKGVVTQMIAGTLLIDGTVYLRRGNKLNGISYDPNTGTTIKAASAMDANMLETAQVSSGQQHYELTNFNLDGNKANQTTGGHGLYLYRWDIANVLRRVRFADFKKNGAYFDYAGTQMGTVFVHELIAVRCDEGAYKISGPVQNFAFYNCTAEKSGLGTYGTYVFEDINNTSTISLINSRSECGNLAAGGGKYNYEVINANGGVINFYNTWTQTTASDTFEASIMITESQARIHAVDYNTGATVNVTKVVSDNVQSRTFKIPTARTREWTWALDRLWVANSASVDSILASVLDANGNTINITINNASPENSIVANTGSIHIRNSAGTASNIYQKISSAGTNDGWLPLTYHSRADFTDGDASPSVSGNIAFRVNNTSGTIINTFDDMVENQEIVLFFNDSVTTINHGAGVTLKGSADVLVTTGNIMKFIKFGGNIYESQRNF